MLLRFRLPVPFPDPDGSASLPSILFRSVVGNVASYFGPRRLGELVLLQATEAKSLSPRGMSFTRSPSWLLGVPGEGLLYIILVGLGCLLAAAPANVYNSLGYQLSFPLSGS